MQNRVCDERDPTDVVPGLHAEKTRYWGPISAEIINRAADEVNWQSDDYRICLTLLRIDGLACPRC
jgi:hypothetical protein